MPFKTLAPPGRARGSLVVSDEEFAADRTAVIATTPLTDEAWTQCRPGDFMMFRDGDLLRHTKTIAVVGLSCDPMRPSHGVSAYMQSNGYRIIPVNPQIEECLGEKAYASLLDVPGKIDIVNIFRRPEFVEEIVDQAIRLKVPAIWMQEEVIHEQAAEKARNAGIFVVMDRCILKEHRARLR